MDSKQIRDLTEAYLSVYGDNILEEPRDLKPHQIPHVDRRINQLIINRHNQEKELRHHINQFYARKKNPVTKYLFGTDRRRNRVMAAAKKLETTKRHLENIKDATSRTLAGDRAREIYNSGGRIRQSSDAASNIRRFKRTQQESYEILMSHLINEGYASTPEAAEKILECMSEEWICSVLNEAEESLADMMKRRSEQLKKESDAHAERASQSMQRIKDLLASSSEYDDEPRSPQPKPQQPMSSLERVRGIKKTIDDAEEKMKKWKD